MRFRPGDAVTPEDSSGMFGDVVGVNGDGTVEVAWRAFVTTEREEDLVRQHHPDCPKTRPSSDSPASCCCTDLAMGDFRPRDTPESA